MTVETTEWSEKQKQQEEKRKKKRAMEITADFENRREKRRKIESGWLLNMNFFSGNQYCDISPKGGLDEENQRYYWQSREVFNHIAPAIDARIAKLSTLRPVIGVRAFSDEDGDVKAAKLASGVLSFVRERISLNETVARATLWAEICGSAFYKITWDEKGGRRVGVDEDGHGVFEGEVGVSALSPFEVFPDRLETEDMDGLQSIIHAQTVSKSYVQERFGVVVQGEPLDKISLSAYDSILSKNPLLAQSKFTGEEGVVLIERYEKPSGTDKDGKLEIVAGGELLYEGPLPYKNGDKGERLFPFVKQDCLHLPSAFYGKSIIDRLIPVQRAYNAVRNRKHEFLNRIAFGVMAVEDGSVDTDALEEEGMAPGKVLVYRQGGKAPELVDSGDVPSEFAKEEEWLEREFTVISGVSDLSKNSMPASVTSASGLRLLIQEDNERLSSTTENVKDALKQIAKQIIFLYRQFAGSARLITMTGENKKAQVYYFNASDLASNDLIFEAMESVTPETKKQTILQLLEAGLFEDENGKITTSTKHKILEAFGFGGYENAQDISGLHIAKASEENIEMLKVGCLADSYDDHDLHVVEHTRFLLSDEFKRRGDLAMKERFCDHIADHEKKKKKSGLN